MAPPAFWPKSLTSAASRARPPPGRGGGGGAPPHRGLRRPAPL